jgi:hypothetical protein
MSIDDLKSNIQKIETNFLPARKEDGEYSEKECLQIDAYIALVHSEIESFLENRCLDICRLSMKDFYEHRKINIVLLGLICFSGKTFSTPPETKDLKKAQKKEEGIDLIKKLESAESVYHYNVKNNNGIKERDILGLLLPLGFPYNQLDDLFLTEMNDFGKQRGEIAHTSNIENAAKNRIDPYSTKNRVDKIIAFLIELDSAMSQLLISA